MSKLLDLIRIFLLLAVLMSTGCQTTEGVVISDTTLAIKQTRISITAAIGEARAVSQNGREISSHFHDRKLKFLDVTPKTRERLYTKVTILGARRPYDLAIEVHVERRDPDSNSFQDVGLDEKLSLLQAKSIHQALNLSREKTQTIDEGSPF